jgi:hypothetical protein
MFEIDPKYLRDAKLVNRIPGVSRFYYGQNQLNRNSGLDIFEVDSNVPYVLPRG